MCELQVPAMRDRKSRSPAFDSATVPPRRLVNKLVMRLHPVAGWMPAPQIIVRRIQEKMGLFCDPSLMKWSARHCSATRSSFDLGIGLRPRDYALLKLCPVTHLAVDHAR